MCAPVYRSVGSNSITGDGAEQLAKVVLEHTTLTDFCSIPLDSLRSNSVTELDLSGKGIGVPGAIVLAALLPSAAALASLKCAALHPRPKCQQPLTLLCAPVHRSVGWNDITVRLVAQVASHATARHIVASVRWALHVCGQRGCAGAWSYVWD